jgi:hypothetical protein
MKNIIMALVILLTTKGFAQTDSTKSQFTLSGYLET